jgi:hypothetical protein
VDHLNYPKYFGGVTLFPAFRKLHFLLTNSNVLSHAEFSFSSAYTTLTFIETLPNRENIGICNLSWRDANSSMYRIVVPSDECRQNVYVPVGVLVGKVLVKFFANSVSNSLYYGTLHVRITADLKLDSLTFQHVLKCFVQKLFASVCAYPDRTSLNGFRIFRIF